MNLRRIYILFFISCFSTLIIFSQTKTLTFDTPFLQTGIDYQHKNYLVFNGFDTYYKKPFASDEWQAIDYKFNALPKTKNFPFDFFQIEGKNYLVASGCGEVYEFRNDSIVRIDNSFDQKNQYNACSFVYKNEIYFWGGYGLFTFKNILTKFDFKTKEWELVKYSNYKNVPLPRDKAISFVKDDYLYILSGFTQDNKTNKIATNQLNDVWKLNLKTKTWEDLGTINNIKDFKIKSSLNEYSYQSNFNCYSDKGSLYNIDFETNTITFYEEKFVFQTSQNEKYNCANDEIFYATISSDDTKQEVKIIVEPFLNYSGKPIKSETFIENKMDRLSLYLTLGTGFLIALVVVFKRKPKLKTQNSISYKNQTFYHKNKIISNLTMDESELLTFLFQNRNSELQMNEVVDFISRNDTTNYNTLTKKKDLILNSLKQKLAFILSVDENDIFIYKKNNNDKRIKEIRLNPEYFNF